MVSSRSWKNSNFNRLMSLALCVGVAFLLLAGSVFAATTNLATGNTVVNYALQAGKAQFPATVYTIPAAAAVRSAAFNRVMAVARQAVSGDFFLDITLQNGLTFNAGRLPNVADISLFDAGVPAGAIGLVTRFSGGLSGNNTVRFHVPVTVSFSTAPTIQIATAGWMVNDTAGYFTGTAAVTSQIEIKTYDANTGAEFDNSGVNTVNFISAVNALTVATSAGNTAIIDTAAGSGRKYFVVGTDDLNRDKGTTTTVTAGRTAVSQSVYKNDASGGYMIDPLDVIYYTVTGNLQGVKYVYFNYGGGVGAEVRQTVTATDVTNGYVVIPVAGANTTISALSNTAVTVPFVIEVDGITQLTTRSFTIGVEATCNFNAVANRTGANALVAAGTALTTWNINGSVLRLNWTSANTAAFKSRIYLFNETNVNNATVIIRLYQIPISANPTAGLPIGTPVTLGKALSANAGMTIRLEDVITAGGYTDTDLKGPDNSYNVAVEVTIYTGLSAGSATLQPVTGYGQTFNAVGMPSVVFGTVPLSRVQ